MAPAAWRHSGRARTFGKRFSHASRHFASRGCRQWLLPNTFGAGAVWLLGFIAPAAWRHSGRARTFGKRFSHASRHFASRGCRQWLLPNTFGAGAVWLLEPVDRPRLAALGHGAGVGRAGPVDCKNPEKSGA